VAEQAGRALYEEHVATPSGIDLEAVAALAGIEHRRAVTPDEVRRAVASPGLVEVPTERSANVRLHRELEARVAAALG
jgi:2-succinyl-5-enolpyruvyl-6-hydroxy-3-cyclohexene-1-carboxylate synthase